MRSVAVVLSLSILAACSGGGDGPATPTAAAPIPAADTCNSIGGTTGATVGILNGATCAPERSSIVKLNLRNASGDTLGGCSGTVIAPRAVLTAAHCLDEGVAIVRVWTGAAFESEIVAGSFAFYPDFRFNQSGFDVGVVLMNEDLPRSSIPILVSREGRVGEPAIIAGWGRDQNDTVAFLRAGSTTLSAVTSDLLEDDLRATLEFRLPGGFRRPHPAQRRRAVGGRRDYVGHVRQRVQHRFEPVPGSTACASPGLHPPARARRDRAVDDCLMIRKLLKAAGVAVAALLVISGTLYVFGARVVLDGGGTPSIAFVQSTDAQAELIAKHREAQKAGAPPPGDGRAPAAPAAPAPPAPSDTGAPAAPADPSKVVTLPDPTASRRSWTDFRGADRSGHYREMPIQTDWPAAGLNPLWKQPVGGGYASFVIADGRAFTIEQRGARKWSRRMTWRPGESCGRARRRRRSASRWGAMDRGRHRRGTRATSMRSARPASCVPSTPRPARPCGGPTSWMMRARRTSNGGCRRRRSWSMTRWSYSQEDQKAIQSSPTSGRRANARGRLSTTPRRMRRRCSSRLEACGRSWCSRLRGWCHWLPIPTPFLGIPLGHTIRRQRLTAAPARQRPGLRLDGIRVRSRRDSIDKRGRSLCGARVVADQSHEESVHQLGAARRIHLRVGRIDSHLYRCKHRCAQMEEWPLWLRPGHARERPSHCPDREWRAGARPRHAGCVPGTGEIPRSGR